MYVRKLSYVYRGFGVFGLPFLGDNELGLERRFDSFNTCALGFQRTRF
jgi:hypothetical protein